MGSQHRLPITIGKKERPLEKFAKFLPAKQMPHVVLAFSSIPFSFCFQEIDVKAGGGKVMKFGELVRAFLLKLEWFETRFPRIPVNTQVR
jgi:hypothetical protein